MQTDSFTRALEDLDPVSRALVELSVRQGLDDADIAEMLGREPADVTHDREDALRRLARDIAPHAKEAPLPELESAIGAAITTVADRRETDKLGAYVLPPAEADAREATRPRLHVVREPEPEPGQPEWLTNPQYEPQHRKPSGSSSRRKILVPVLLVLLAVAVIVGIQRSGSDDTDTANTPAPAPAAQANDVDEDTTSLTPLPGAPDGAKGSISISDGTLDLDVTGLPEGTYSVWLFNSLIDSKQIATAEGTSIELSEKLPANAADYEYVDISREPADGNPNHSGESVLRVPVN